MIVAMSHNQLVSATSVGNHDQDDLSARVAGNQ